MSSTRYVFLYGPQGMIWQGEADSFDNLMVPHGVSIPDEPTLTVFVPVPLEPVPDFPFVRLPKEEDSDA